MILDNSRVKKSCFDINDLQMDELKYIDDLYLYFSFDGYGRQILTLRITFIDNNKKRISIRFDDVVNLSINSFSGPYIQIVGFEIIDLVSKGYESCRYKINDYENNAISFFCNDICILFSDSIGG